MSGSPSSTAVSPGTGDNIAEWQFSEASTTKKMQRVALGGYDGSDITGSNTDAAAANTDTTPLSWTSILKQLSLSLQAIASSTVRVAESFTFGATGTRAAFFCLGNIVEFANILPAAAPYNGILESITVKFKGSIQLSVGYWVALFDTGTLSGTFEDGSACAIGSTDSAHLLGVYHLTVGASPLGNHTIYNMDGIGKAIQGASPNLWVVVAPDATTTTFGSDTDMSVELGVIWG